MGVDRHLLRRAVTEVDVSDVSDVPFVFLKSLLEEEGLRADKDEGDCDVSPLRSLAAASISTSCVSDLSFDRFFASLLLLGEFGTVSLSWPTLVTLFEPRDTISSGSSLTLLRLTFASVGGSFLLELVASLTSVTLN